MNIHIIHMYVYMYKYMYVYKYIHIYIHVYMYTYRQKIINLCIDLKSINEDRLRTHIQSADLSGFLMLYLTTSLSAPWTQVLLLLVQRLQEHYTVIQRP